MSVLPYLPTNSQKKTIEFYKTKTNKFDNILSITQDTNSVITIETPTETYKIGKLGGVTTTPKKPRS